MNGIMIMDNKKRLKKTLICIVLVCILSAAAFFWYTNDYYHAESAALQFLQSSKSVQVSQIDKGYYFDGKGTEKALVFYPGGKVEFTAYAPLMMELSESGIDCFLLEMPFHLAVFGMNKAESIMQEYTYSDWYLSGHSLGGAMAASYASNHIEALAGVVLLAAYPTDSLLSDDFQVISIYGEKDGVLNKEKYKESMQYMPEGFFELCIEGGNHAGFGMYGKQKGDGIAGITGDKQRTLTVEFILQQIME